jgi:fatty acid desaturase
MASDSTSADASSPPAPALRYDARVADSPVPLIAGDVLTLPELRHLRRVSGPRGAGLVLHAWAVIIGAMLLYVAWPSAVTLVLAVALIGARQLGLAVLMHEGAHWRLASGPGLNNRIARWLCAYPIGADLAGYRRRHHLHHRHTRQADDPDLALAAPYPVSRGVFWRDVLCDLIGVTACRRALAWRAPDGDGVAPAWSRWRGPLAANAVLLVAVSALGHWELYLLLWLLPLATWYLVISRIRDIAEHALASEDDDPLRNTRTVLAGFLARTFVAPYWVNYHLEHHLLVFVPCWKLREAHALLVAKGYRPRMEVAASYAAVIRLATSPTLSGPPPPPPP